ncbi:hypothetical protein CPB86DRAFT_734937 [Serendipita vermifera]|nr:hypothetical protein CPB86DRAFT_734937 [Serendipita vermifera]
MEIDAQVLIFYCSENELSSACDYLHSSLGNESPPNVLISPNEPLKISRMYRNGKYSVNPLGLLAEDLSLCDILDLLTHPFNDQGSIRFQNKVNLIASQLSEPIDIQRLYQLIDEENWDDGESTFIALRQTLLTKMVALAEDGFRASLGSHRQILVDLRDGILRKTHIDLILMNAVLREFLSTCSDRKKLIVVVHSERILNTISRLSKSLEFIAQSRLANILLTTTDFSILSSPTYQESDFIFHTQSNSPIWKDALMKHFPQAEGPSLMHRKGALGVFSPSSVHVRRQEKAGYTFRHWDHDYRSIYIEHNLSVPLATEKPIYRNDGSKLGPSVEVHSDIAVNDVISPFPSPSLPGDGGTFKREDPMLRRRDTSGNDELMKIYMEHMHCIEGTQSIKIMLPDIEIEGIAVQGIPIHTPLPEEPPTPDQQEADFEAIISHFPSRHRLLISAIISLAEPNMTAFVNFEDVRKKVGSQSVIKKLGWSSFTTWVKFAREDNCVEQLVGPGGSLQLRLTFPDSIEGHSDQDIPNSIGVPASHAHSQSVPAINQVTGKESSHEISSVTQPTPVASDAEEPFDTDRSLIATCSTLHPNSYTNPNVLIAEDVCNNRLDSDLVGVNPDLYPRKFRPLVNAIAQLSDNRANIQVDFEEVRKLIGTKEDVQALKLGWVTVTQMVNQAEKDCYIEQGKTGKEKWIALSIPFSSTQMASLKIEQEATEGAGPHFNGTQRVKVEPDLYPERFRPLIKAIFQLCENYTEVEVDFEQVRGKIGTQQSVKSLGFGWGTFSQMISEAVLGKWIQQGIGDGSRKWLKALLPHSFQGITSTPAMKQGPQTSSTSIVTSSSTIHGPTMQAKCGEMLTLEPTVESNWARTKSIQEAPVNTQTSQLETSDYPSELYPLVFSILSLTTKRSSVKAQYDEVWRVFQAFEGFTDTSHESLFNLIKLGTAWGVLSSGMDKGSLWLVLEDPWSYELIGSDVTDNVDVFSKPGEKPNASSVAVSQEFTPEYGHFAPLIVILAALRNDHRVSMPFAQPVSNCVLKYVPDILQRANYPTMTAYIDGAEARGFIKTFGEGDQRIVTLEEEHVGIDVRELLKEFSLDERSPRNHFI